MRVRVKRGREWVELGSIHHPWHSKPSDGLEEYRIERRRSLTRDRVRRWRERQRLGAESYEGPGAAGP